MWSMARKFIEVLANDALWRISKADTADQEYFLAYAMIVDI